MPRRFERIFFPNLISTTYWLCDRVWCGLQNRILRFLIERFYPHPFLTLFCTKWKHYNSVLYKVHMSVLINRWIDLFVCKTSFLTNLQNASVKYRNNRGKYNFLQKQFILPRVGISVCWISFKVSIFPFTIQYHTVLQDQRPSKHSVIMSF